MSDDFEDQLKQWLRHRAGDDRAALQALAGNVATLPPRRARPNRLVPLAAGIAVLVGVAWLLSPRLGSVTNQAASTPTNAAERTPMHPQATPGGPVAFAGDPRLSRCFGTADDMEFVFEMTHARDYQRYLPRMLLAPELDVDGSALVVIYREGWAGPMITGVPGAKPATPIPGRRFVCAIVSGGDPTLYADVDVTGLTLDVVPSSPARPRHPYRTLRPPADPRRRPPRPRTPAPRCCSSAVATRESSARAGSPAISTPRRCQRGNEPSPTFSTVSTRRPHHSRRPASASPTRRPTARSTRSRSVAPSVPSSSPDRTKPTARALARNRRCRVRTQRAGCRPAIGAVAGIWRDPTGSVAPSDAVSETADCYHGRMLRVDGRLFVWDPDAVAGQIYDPANLDAALALRHSCRPTSVDTGYVSSGRQLYLARMDRPRSSPAATASEQWPHVKGDDYQRTDCN